MDVIDLCFSLAMLSWFWDLASFTIHGWWRYGLLSPGLCWIIISWAVLGPFESNFSAKEDFTNSCSHRFFPFAICNPLGYNFSCRFWLSWSCDINCITTWCAYVQNLPFIFSFAHNRSFVWTNFLMKCGFCLPNWAKCFKSLGHHSLLRTLSMLPSKWRMESSQTHFRRTWFCRY